MQRGNRGDVTYEQETNLDSHGLELENPMKPLALMLVSALLAGCASTVRLTDNGNTSIAEGTIRYGATEPHAIEIMLEGKRYAGTWTRMPAPEHPDARKWLHARHVGKTKSTLRADTGTILTCEWLSHSEIIDGQCLLPDGRRLRLVGP